MRAVLGLAIALGAALFIWVVLTGVPVFQNVADSTASSGNTASSTSDSGATATMPRSTGGKQ